MGVGIFTQDFTIIHSIVASVAFLFSGLSAIISAKLLEKPLMLISEALGTMTIGALALFSMGIVTSGSITSDIAYDSIFYLGLGPGGMEHMIVFPVLIWLVGFSWYLALQKATP